MGWIPPRLDLDHLLGYRTVILQLDKDNIQIVMMNEKAFQATIMTRRGWELIGPDGRLLDRDQPREVRKSTRIQQLIGQGLVEYHVAESNSLRLRFDSGHVLVLRVDPAREKIFYFSPNVFL